MENKPTVANDPSKGTFEASLRVLGNEFIGIKLVVDDMKQQWIVVGILTIMALGLVVDMVGPTIVQMFK